MLGPGERFLALANGSRRGAALKVILVRSSGTAVRLDDTSNRMASRHCPIAVGGRKRVQVVLRLRIRMTIDDKNAL